MRTAILCALVVGLALSGCAAADPGLQVLVEPRVATAIGSQVASAAPEITLFDSVARVRHYLETEAEQDYADKYLHSITYHFSGGHPRVGPCWLYRFAFERPRLGGDVSIYHFMDGEIIEFHHGP